MDRMAINEKNVKSNGETSRFTFYYPFVVVVVAIYPNGWVTTTTTTTSFSMSTHTQN